MITEDEIRRLALLARLDPSAAQVSKLCPQVGSVLTYVERLAKLPLRDVPVMTHVLADEGAKSDPNVLRNDELKASLSLEDTLRNAPESAVRFFKVPPAIAEES